jgi:hypothetical protein
VRRETDDEQGMKESNSEGLATHADPESCAGIREGVGEALTGAGAGRVSSRENQANSGVPTLYGKTEGNTADSAKAKLSADPARSKTPSMQRSSTYGNREIPPPTCVTQVRAVKPKSERRR